MTRVGKTLVLLLSALSVLFMGFAISVVSTWTDWPVKYKAEVTKLDEETKKRNELQLKIDELGRAITAEIEQHQKDRVSLGDKRKVQEKAHNEQSKNLDQAIKDVLDYTVRAKKALDEGSDLRKKTEDLQEKIKATQQERDDAMKERFAKEQERNQLEGSHETISARREALKKRSDQLKSILTGPEAASDSKDKSKKIIENPISKK